MHRQTLLKPPADDFAEGQFQVAADDENELGETGAQGVEDRIINDGFAGGADGSICLRPP